MDETGGRWAPTGDIAPYWNWRGYQERAGQVYWNKKTPACRSKGPGKAECLLPPGHEGPCYGNGYDEWGPKGAIRWGETAHEARADVRRSPR